MRQLICLFLLLLSPLLRAADVVLPTPGKLLGVVVSEAPGDWGVIDASMSPVTPKFVDGSVETGWRVCMFEGPPGTYAVFKVPKGGGLSITKVVLGGLVPTPPTPPGPIPPGPGPDPTPSPSPISVTGFRVMILHEASPQTKQTEALQAIASSPAIHAYLNSRCVKESNGQPSWRVWDDDYSDEDLKNAPDYWRSAYRIAVSKKQGDQGWIVIGTDKGGTSEPLPATVEATLALLKKWGDI